MHTMFSLLEYLHFIFDDLISLTHTGRDREKNKEMQKLIWLSSTDTEFKKKCNTHLCHFQVYFCRETRACPGIFKKMNELKKWKAKSCK